MSSVEPQNALPPAWQKAAKNAEDLAGNPLEKPIRARRVGFSAFMRGAALTTQAPEKLRMRPYRRPLPSRSEIFAGFDIRAVYKTLVKLFIDDLAGDERPQNVKPDQLFDIKWRTPMSTKRANFLCRRDELPAGFFSEFLDKLNGRGSDDKTWEDAKAGYAAHYYHVDILHSWLEDYALSIPTPQPERIEYAVNAHGMLYALARELGNAKRISVYPTRLLPMIISPFGVRLFTGPCAEPKDITAMVTIERILHAGPTHKAVTVSVSSKGGDHAALVEDTSEEAGNDGQMMRVHLSLDWLPAGIVTRF